MSEALNMGRLHALADPDEEGARARFHADDDADQADDTTTQGLRALFDRVLCAALGAVQGAAAGWAHPEWAREAAEDAGPAPLSATVEAVLSRTVDVVRPAATLDEVARRLWERDCGALPVVDPQIGRRVVGMITDRDVCMAAWSRGVPLHDLRVEQVMTRDLVVCRPTDSVREAHDRMRESRVRRLPVIDGEGGLVGVVALADLVRHALRASPETCAAEAAAVLETLDAVCTAHTAE